MSSIQYIDDSFCALQIQIRWTDSRVNIGLRSTGRHVLIEHFDELATQ
jgi:hypothetical protein